MQILGQLDLILLFFFLGIIAGLARVSLKLPDAIVQYLSFYLLLTIGFKGGVAVVHAESLGGLLPVLVIGLASCVVIPAIVFRLTKSSFGVSDGAALAASYGSVSAVTFVVAVSILEAREVAYSGYMVAVMAMMEIPAIAIAMLLYKSSVGSKGPQGESFFRAAFAHKSIFLLVGGFLIGMLIDQKNQVAMKPFFVDAFKGILAFYLMDLGASAVQELRVVWARRYRAVVFACGLPLIFGSTALVSAWALGLAKGNGILVSVLVGSASYIAAPAAIRISIPDASPALYTSLPMGLTFPFNVLFGIPVYTFAAQLLWGIS